MNPWISPLTRENYFEFKEYLGRPVIHSSCLSSIYPGEGGSVKRLQMYFEAEKAADKPHQSLGKLFHKYLENKKDFVIVPDDRPEPGICAIVDEFHAGIGPGTVMGGDDASIKAAILTIARNQNYQANWKDDTIVNKVIEKGTKYFEFLVSARGHHMLTSKQKEQFEGMSTSILSSPWADVVFSKKAEHEVPVLFKVTYDGEDIWCKALLDWLVMNDKVINVIDFKTTSKPIGSFLRSARVEMHLGENGWYEMIKPIPGSYWNYRYYRQLTFYRDAVANLFLQRNPEWKKEVPEISLNVLPIESIAPYECDMPEIPYTSSLIGRTEIGQCFTEIAKYYKTLKKY